LIFSPLLIIADIAASLLVDVFHFRHYWPYADAFLLRFVFLLFISFLFSLIFFSLLFFASLFAIISSPLFRFSLRLFSRRHAAAALLPTEMLIA